MKKKILLLEDEAIHQRIMEIVLGKDYGLICVENGQQALHWLGRQRETPDLIIMDWVMPQMDGKSFLTHLQGERRLTQIPVIVVSSYAHVRQELTDLRFAAHSALTKPIDPVLLKQSIHSAFQLRTGL